ncbi:MAG TPA: hypothetical protein VLK33_07005 [Terriglobales bacterium]|nr:hypothetical protein [Terriglobales bacterium]
MKTAPRFNGHIMDAKLQKAFNSAIAAVGDSAKKSARQTPIYRRPERTQMHAVKDAATALSALWKMHTPSFKS